MSSFSHILGTFDFLHTLKIDYGFYLLMSS